MIGKAMVRRDGRVDAKRFFDVVVASTGLVLTAPLMAALAVVIRLDGGPVIFRQERVGRHGVVFRIHKFRTMRTGSHGAFVTPSGDARITRFGALLRRTKLDELPQLIDVLRGSMSLVGPRPEIPQYVALWPKDSRQLILSVRPGITDPATVLLRHESEELAGAADPEDYYVTELLPRKVAMYVRYVEHRSFSSDLRILFSTARALTRMQGAKPASKDMP